MDKNIVISVKTILIGIVMALIFYVLYLLAPIFGFLFLSTLIVISIEPLVKKLMGIILFNKPLPRGIAVIFSYILLIVVFSLIGTISIKPALDQVGKMLGTLSDLAINLRLGPLDISVSDVLTQATKIGGDFLSVVNSVINNVFAVITIITLAVFISMDWENIKKQFISLFSEEKESEIKSVFKEIETNVSGWVKGQLILMCTIGLVSFIGLTILGVKYTSALAVLAGFLEVVPTFGPIISAIIAGVVALSDSPIKAVGVIALFIVIQQLENNILVPKIMQKVTGFSPLIILIALLVGGKLFGIIGTLISVPSIIIGAVILKRVLKSKD